MREPPPVGTVCPGMNSHHFIPLLGVALGAAAFGSAGCSPRNDPPPATSFAASESRTATTAASRPADSVAEAVGVPGAPANVVADNVAVRWPELETLTYERRGEFMAGVRRMEAAVDQQIAELNAKRATMAEGQPKRDWDVAMKEMNDARSYLRSVGEEASSASSETWEQQKDKVGTAWKRAQEAYDKVKRSTTS